MNHPFTNIGQILALHNKVSPDKVFLTAITPEGREALSYAEFSARAYQTANFLQDKLGIKPGDMVAIKHNDAADLAVLFVACWLVGAVVTQEFNGQEKAYFLWEENSDLSSLIAESIYWKGSQTQLIKLSSRSSQDPDFQTLVHGMSTTFSNKYSEPTLNTPAYYSKVQGDPSIEVFSQGLLLERAKTLAIKQVITSNQRLISYMELGGLINDHEVTLRTLAFFLTPMLLGGSIMIANHYYASVEQDLFWREVADSSLNIACLRIEDISKLTKYARERQTAGKPIHGEGVYQEDIKQLRHIYCPDVFGQEAKHIIQQFTALYRFPVVTNSS